MARLSKLRLTDRGIKALKAPGYYADGDGLYLRIAPSGTKSWVYRFRWKEKGQPGAGKLSDMGLGSLDIVSLKAARDTAVDARRLVKQGVNPIQKRQAENAAPALITPETVTLRNFGAEMIDTWAPGFKCSRNPDGNEDPRKKDKQKKDWTRTLEYYCAPIIDMPINEIGVDECLAVIQPIWTTNHDTAIKARHRLERWLSAATVAKHRTGPNPAVWRHNLEHMLPRVKKTVKHHAAMPFQMVPDFIKELRELDFRGALALEYLMFTLVRTHEICFSEKSEINFTDMEWNIPGNRMKGTDAPAHTVPLVDQALCIARLGYGLTDERNQYLFGSRTKKSKRAVPLAGSTMDKILQSSLGYAEYTVHGFRSTFRDWAGDETDHDEEIAERSLAHKRGSSTEQAYRRAKALAKRRRLMQDWANFIDPTPPASRRWPLSVS